MGKLSDTTCMNLFTLSLLIVILPWLSGRIIKHWKDLKPKKSFEESDIERRLNESQADGRFESTWNMIGAEEAQSREKPQWNTPDEMLREEQLKRRDATWTPRIPGVLHDRGAAKG